MDKNFRRGPFKGQRLSEIPITELNAYLRSEQSTWDKNLELTEAIQDEWQRRAKGDGR
jgi:hypothetical protein